MGFFNDDLAVDYSGGTDALAAALADEARAMEMTVDMGLPSGNRWARANLCAQASPCSGGFWMWGDLKRASRMHPAGDGGYPYFKGFDDVFMKITKYSNDDKCRALLREDDPCAAFNPMLSTPTVADFVELRDHTRRLVSDGGVTFCSMAPGGGTLFIPFAGKAGGSADEMLLWTADLADDPCCAYAARINKAIAMWSSYQGQPWFLSMAPRRRSDALPIRPVMRPAR